jgi:hypothetical protein
LNTGGYANASGLGQTFQPSRDVHPVTEDVVVLHNDVALVNADTELDAIVARCSGISLIHPVLPFGCPTQCVNHTGEFDQQAVPGRFDNTAPVFCDLRVDNLRPDRPQLVEGSFLVSPDQPRVARHVGGEDRSEAAGNRHIRSPVANRRPDRSSSV